MGYRHLVRRHVLGTAVLAVLVGIGISIPLAASPEGEEIYILTEHSTSTTDVSSQGYAFESIGTVPGARRLAVPENGDHILILAADGSVWTWRGESGALAGARRHPVQGTWSEVGGLGGVTSIAAGALHSVALKGDGTVWTWGANQQGQLGDGSLAERTAAAAVPGLNEIKMIAAGWAFTLAVRADGTVWTWGSNWNEIAPGDGRRTIPEPVQVQGLSAIESVAVYRNRGYAKDNQGRFWVWGRSDGGENSAVTELSATGISQLAARVMRQLGDTSQTLALQSEWQGSFVQVSGSTLAVSRKSAENRFSFKGTVMDVDWGWAVAMITSAPAAESANAKSIGRPVRGTGASGAGKVPIAAAPRTSGPLVTAAPVGTLTASQTHGLVVNASGSACGMGHNEYGELGDGTTVDRWTPAQMTTETGLTGISKLATGWYHSLALRSDGTIWAWGYNGFGALGDGTTTDKVTPFPGGGSLTNVIDVAAGQYFSMALKNDGTVWSWGYNANGQLGDGTTTGKTTPVQVILLTGVTQIAAGQNHSLALKSDGTVWAWGYNGYGQLGNGTTTSASSAVQVTGLSGVVRIAAGAYSSMALKSDGTVWAWGNNGYGELGDGGTLSSSSIVSVSGLNNVIDIAMGDYHALAVKGDGSVWAWGYNGYGELGNGTTTNQSTPVQVSQPTGFANLKAVAAGSYFSIALKSDGTLWAWGHNDFGELGNGTTTDNSVPVASSACTALPAGPTTASRWSARLTAYWTHSLAIKPDGSVWGWGLNEYGELGDGTTITHFSPVQSVITNATQISTGRYHTLAVRSDRTVWAWGYNGYGNLGDGTTSNRVTPVQVQSLTGAIGAAAGQYHSVAVRSDGTVWGWGYNGNGQLGDGTTTERTTPVQAILLSGVIQVSAGADHTLALKSDGTVWAWGYNGYGQLGDGTTTSRTSAVQVLGLNNVISIAAGTDYSLALRIDGTVWGWGANSYGVLGEGSSTYRPTIVRASGLDHVIDIVAGEYHSLAVKSDGTVWAWGYNAYGELGDTTSTNRNIPVQTTEASGLTGALAGAAGEYYSLALKNDGTIWAWGHNDVGQFGNGSTVDSTIPVGGPNAPNIGPLPQSTGTALKFVPVSPCRIADTRNPAGAFGGPAITGGTSRSFVIPSSACGIPSNAAAYSLNVTVVPHGTLGYLTMWPTGQAFPVASTLNSLDGRVKANAAIVPAGSSGAISVYVTDTTDVILDINGYFVPTNGPTTLTFYPLTPCRIADTRNGTGALGGPSLAAGQGRSFPILSSTCGIPASAKAYSLNFTAVPQGPLGFISTWPTGLGQPLVSTLNAIGGQVTANAAIVPAGTSGQIDVYATNNTDLVIDINGYFAPPGVGGLSLYNTTPCRVVDTRFPSGSLPQGGTQSISVEGSLCALPGNAQAYVLSATVVPSGLLGYLSLWPEGQAQPVVSTLNALDGAITSNMAIVPTANGFINSYAANATYLILDISGYFAQ